MGWCHKEPSATGPRQPLTVSDSQSRPRTRSKLCLSSPPKRTEDLVIVILSSLPPPHYYCKDPRAAPIYFNTASEDVSCLNLIKAVSFFILVLRTSMPLPSNGVFSLQGHSKPGDTQYSKPKQAMMVRMSSETLDALESQPKLQFEFGDNPVMSPAYYVSLVTHMLLRVSTLATHSTQ